MTRRQAVRRTARHAAGRVMDGIVAAGCSLSAECLRLTAQARQAPAAESRQALDAHALQEIVRIAADRAQWRADAAQARQAPAAESRQALDAHGHPYIVPSAADRATWAEDAAQARRDYWGSDAAADAAETVTEFPGGRNQA